MRFSWAAGFAERLRAEVFEWFGRDFVHDTRQMSDRQSHNDILKTRTPTHRYQRSKACLVEQLRARSFCYTRTDNLGKHPPAHAPEENEMICRTSSPTICPTRNAGALDKLRRLRFSPGRGESRSIQVNPIQVNPDIIKPGLVNPSQSRQTENSPGKSRSIQADRQQAG